MAICLCGPAASCFGWLLLLSGFGDIIAEYTADHLPHLLLESEAFHRGVHARPNSSDCAILLGTALVECFHALDKKLRLEGCQMDVRSLQTRTRQCLNLKSAVLGSQEGHNN